MEIFHQPPLFPSLAVAFRVVGSHNDIMKRFLTALLSFLSLPLIGQETRPPKMVPAADYVLHVEVKVDKPRTVLGPMKTDENGKTTGSFAVYGGSSLIQVS